MATQEQPGCVSCGCTNNLFMSPCHHINLCVPCGKRMIECATPCPTCEVPFSRLIRECNINAYPTTKPFFVGRFLHGVPFFTKKKGNEPNWSMVREGLQSRRVSEAPREKQQKGKVKSLPIQQENQLVKSWLLNGHRKQSFRGALEGGQQSSYYILSKHKGDMLAIPAGAWYKFHKVTDYKRLTLEEAEEKMQNRRKTEDGYPRWLMKAANAGATAFDEAENLTLGSGRGGFTLRVCDDDDDLASSDKGEEDADEEEDRKRRLDMNKKSGDEDEDGQELARGYDHEFDDEKPKRGDEDWEHKKTFTDDDDDDAVGNDTEEMTEEEDDSELQSAPQNEEEEMEGRRKKRRLSKSGLELQELLRKRTLDDAAENDRKEERSKEEPLVSKPVESSDASKKPSLSASSRKVKMDSSQEAAAKARTKSPPRPNDGPSRTGPVGTRSPPRPHGGPSRTGPVTEDDLKAVLKQGPIKMLDLVKKFKRHLKTQKDKEAFQLLIVNLTKTHKTDDGKFVALKNE
ncbi:hypothetical protein GOP47_0004267 [Adiantum capillus-veneris]|uniref:Transcription initiation factor IIF subunit alpha n=1 Tax=Adiantum capillus-veneris TaxID=13818 RepID=A0A9D4ZMP8_ADICA|nr:hypothetical protein GOP47_0004267 [Adiantum capillus-veneris]